MPDAKREQDCLFPLCAVASLRRAGELRQCIRINPLSGALKVGKALVKIGRCWYNTAGVSTIPRFSAAGKRGI